MSEWLVVVSEDQEAGAHNNQSSSCLPASQSFSCFKAAAPISINWVSVLKAWHQYEPQNLIGSEGKTKTKTSG